MVKTSFPINAFNTTFLSTRGNMTNASIMNQWHTITPDATAEKVAEEAPKVITQTDSSGKSVAASDQMGKSGTGGTPVVAKQTSSSVKPPG